MKKSILILIASLLFTMFTFSQEETASYYKNAAGVNGSKNSSFGLYAGRNNIDRENVFLGYISGVENVKGQGNVFVGSQSGAKGEYGSYNVFNGYQSGFNNTGNHNTFLGSQTGFGNEKGQGNVYIGYQAGFQKERSNTLYIENSSSTSPLIWGDFKNDLVNINGRFGINNSNPSSAFNLGHTTVRNDNYMVFGKRVTTEEFNLPYIGHDSVEGKGNDLALGARSSSGSINFYTGNQAVFNSSVGAIKMRILPNGYVGIGTTTPDEKLAVNGKIHAKEVRVDMTGWPDYVFTTYYNLPTLKEVENHIKKEGHLQNIPSAEEVKENGILLGNMNAKLLEKIEELTLYTIQQQKELEAQKEKNNALENRLNKLEQLINSGN